MSSEKRAGQTRLRLVVNNADLPKSNRGHTTRPPKGPLKVRRESFDVAHARIFDFPTSDFFYRSLRETGVGSHLTPPPLRRLQALQDKLVHQTHSPKDKPEFGSTQPSNGV